MSIFLPECVKNIYSVSVVVGSEACQCNCAHCGGKRLGQPKRSKCLDTIVAASRLALQYQAWTLSITGTGEPMLDPGQITTMLYSLKVDGCRFPYINLFTNNVLYRTDHNTYMNLLKEWKELGLTSVVTSIHSVNKKENDAIYRADVPSFREVFPAVRELGLVPRAVLLLGRGQIDTPDELKKALRVLRAAGCRMVTCWPLGEADGSRNEYTPSRFNMARLHFWLRRNTQPVMYHPWTGGVRSYGDMTVRLTSYVTKHDPKGNFIRQLVVLPDGSISYSWFEPGMLCHG